MNAHAITADLHRAIAHHQEGRLQDAAAIYLDIIEIDPRQTDALYLLGLVGLQWDQLDLAEAYLQRAVAVEPQFGEAWYHLALLRHRQDRLDESARYLETALKYAPNHADALAFRRDLSWAYQLKNYQANFIRSRRSVYLDFPSHVHMETLAVCNASCSFCPYEILERKGTVMADGLVEKVLHDLAEIPRTVPFQLSPFKVNEPFLDKRIFKIMRTINEKLPHAAIALTSNASPLTAKKLDELSEIQNLAYLWLSINDHRPIEYEALMKLPFQRTVERLNQLHQYKAAGKFNGRVVLARVGDRTEVDEQFIEWVRTRYPLFEVSVTPRGDWIGQVDLQTTTVPNVACGRWFELSITATGKVAHCCMDGQAKWPIGDVNEQTALEVYNAPHYRQLREKTLSRLKVSPCNRCTFL